METNSIKGKREVELILNALDGLEFKFSEGFINLVATVKVEEDTTLVDYFRSSFEVYLDIKAEVDFEVYHMDFGEKKYLSRVNIDDKVNLNVSGMGLGLEDDNGEEGVRHGGREYYVKTIVEYIDKELEGIVDEYRTDIKDMHSIRRAFNREIGNDNNKRNRKGII